MHSSEYTEFNRALYTEGFFPLLATTVVWMRRYTCIYEVHSLTVQRRTSTRTLSSVITNTYSNRKVKYND